MTLLSARGASPNIPALLPPEVDCRPNLPIRATMTALHATTATCSLAATTQLQHMRRSALGGRDPLKQPEPSAHPTRLNTELQSSRKGAVVPLPSRQSPVVRASLLLSQPVSHTSEPCETVTECGGNLTSGQSSVNLLVDSWRSRKCWLSD